jgi:phosphatidylinositol glycan class N
MPILDRKAIPDASLRLKSYVLGFSPIFVILSIREEGIFYTTFALLVCTWADLEPTVASEKPLSKHGTRSLRFDDARLALTFLFFVQVAFFGAGK